MKIVCRLRLKFTFSTEQSSAKFTATAAFDKQIELVIMKLYDVDANKILISTLSHDNSMSGNSKKTRIYYY